MGHTINVRRLVWVYQQSSTLSPNRERREWQGTMKIYLEGFVDLYIFRNRLELWSKGCTVKQGWQ